jgi:EAL domain-containing protein (putative c-di-GMP-specific phosphodiesterase class I)
MITGLAEHLGIEVVAEGIETLEQVALLQSLACGKAQGYLFSRPARPTRSRSCCCGTARCGRRQRPPPEARRNDEAGNAEWTNAE